VRRPRPTFDKSTFAKPGTKEFPFDPAGCQGDVSGESIWHAIMAETPVYRFDCDWRRVRRVTWRQSAPGSSARRSPASSWNGLVAPCLNWGCIPSKALLKSAELYLKMKQAETFGLGVQGLTFDFAKIMQRSRDVADQMAKGVEFLFRKYKVDYFIGLGQVTGAGPGRDHRGRAQGEVLQDAERFARHRLQGAPAAGPAGRWRAHHDLAGGAGAARAAARVGRHHRCRSDRAAEFCLFLNAFGSKVTMIEVLPQVVPAEDEEVARTLAAELRETRASSSTPAPRRRTSRWAKTR